MSDDRIAELESRIFELTTELNGLRKAHTGSPVPDYPFTTPQGSAGTAEAVRQCTGLAIQTGLA